MKQKKLYMLGSCIILILLVGCVPNVIVHHSPIHPQNGSTVTFTASCSSGDPIDYVNILVNAVPVKTCNAGASATSLDCIYTGGPYTSDTSVSYGANCYDTDGDRDWTGYITTAYGTGATYGAGKINPIGVKGISANNLDIVFFRDRDGGTISYSVADYRSDVEDKIYAEYFVVNPIDDNWDKMNFYYYYSNGNEASSDGCGTLPAGFTLPTWVDAWAVLHNYNRRDCSSGIHFTAEGYQTKAFTHESGHGVFGLADEYCCDSFYWYNTPNPNIWPSLAACQSDAASMGWDTSNCRQYCPPGSGNCGSGWYRWCPDPDIMANGHHTAGYIFHEACERRIKAVFSAYPEQGVSRLGPGSLDKLESLNQEGVIYNTMLQLASSTKPKFTPMRTATPKGVQKSLVMYFHIDAADTITLKDWQVIPSSPPDHVVQYRDFLAETVSSDGSVISQIGLWHPRRMITEEGVEYLQETDFRVVMPFADGMEKFNLYYLAGESMLEKGAAIISIDVSGAE